MPHLIFPRRPPQQKRELSERSWQILHAVDNILLDSDQRDELSYKTIRRKLNRVPRAERGLDWTERVVALYCVKRMKSLRSAALKISIRQQRLEAGQMAEFEAFSDRLQKTIAPWFLTNHGLMLPFAHRDQAEVANDLTALFSLLDQLGYTSFINSGTLLGAVREGQFLGHDDDADLAVLIDGKDDDTVVASLGKLCDDLNASGKLLQPARFQRKGPSVKLLVGSGIEVDLFPLWFREGRAFIWPHTYGELTEADILPLSKQRLCGTDMPAPRNAEKMLTLNYGENWRHPDPDYFFPWKEAEIRFQSVIQTYVKQHGKPSFGHRIRKLLGLNPK